MAVEVEGVPRQDHRAAGGQGHEELEDREVERDGGGRQDRRELVAGVLPEGPGHQGGGRAVGDRHSLGPAGGARGVDEVGERVGQRRGRRGRRRLLAPARLRPAGERRLQGHDPPSQAAGTGGVRPVRDDPGGARVRRHQAEPLLGVAGIERQVGPTRPEDAQEGGDQRGRTLRQHRHRRLPRHPQAAQAPGQAVGALQEAGVGQALAARRDGDGVRPPRAGGGDQGRQGELRRAGRGRGAAQALRRVPLHQELVRLGRRQERQLRQRPVRLPGGRRGDGDELASQATSGRPVEQVGVVAQGGGDPAPVLHRGEQEVEGRAPLREGDGLEGQAAQLHPSALPAQEEPGQALRGGAVGPLEGEHDLEEGRSARVPAHAQALHDAGERVLLVLEPRHRRLAGAAEEATEARLPGEIEPQGQGVDQVAHRLGQVRVRPAGGGGADHQVLGAGEAPEPGGEGGEEGREEGRRLAPGEPCEGRGDVRPEVQAHRRAAKALDRRARPVGRQLQDLGRPGEGAPPVRPEGLAPAAGEASGLPGRELGRGRPGRRKRRLLAGGGGAVEPPQLVEQQHQGAQVDGDVVDGHQEGVIVRRAAPETDPQERPPAEVEGAVGLGVEPGRRLAVAPAGGARRREVDARLRRRHDPLDRLAALLGEAGAQGGVARHQAAHRPAQGRGLERTADAGPERQVVGRALGGQAVEQPERPLAVGEGDRDPRLDRRAHPVGRPLLAAAGRGGGEGAEQAIGQVLGAHPREQLGQRGRRPQGRLQARLELGRGQGVEGHLPAGVEALGRHSQGAGQEGPESRNRHRPALVRRERGQALPVEAAGRRAGRTGRGGGRRGRLGPRPGQAPGDDVEAVLEIGRPARPAADLAARGLGQGARGEQHHLVDRGLVLRGHGGADRRRHLLRVRPRAADHLVGHHQALLAGDLDPEGGAGARPQPRVAERHRVLHVLGVEVAPPEDDEVLDPAGDEQLTAVEETQVAGAQVRPRAGGGPGLEGGGRLLRPAPVAAGDAGPGDPDLAHPARAQAPAVGGIDDRHLPRPGAAAADEAPGRGSVPAAVVSRAHGLHGVALQRLGPEASHGGRRRHGAAGDEKGRLGQPVAGVERLAAKARRSEGRREPLQGLGPHRLGAVEGHSPGGEVEAPAGLGRHPVHAQLVGEARATAHRRPSRRDRFEPPGRPLEEGGRRHQVHRKAGVEGAEDAADEPHVVVGREPDQPSVRRRQLEGGGDGGQVREEVRVGEDHPLGPAGGAGGVLEEGDGPGLELRGPPPLGVLRPVPLLRQPVEPGEGVHGIALLAPPGRDPVAHRPVGEGEPGRGVLGDGGEARQAPVAPRRVDGDRHDAGVEAAEEGRDVLETRRVDEEGAGARLESAAEARGDGLGAEIELAVGQGAGFTLAVREEGESDLSRARAGAVPGQVHQRGPPRLWFGFDGVHYSPV